MTKPLQTFKTLKSFKPYIYFTIVAIVFLLIVLFNINRESLWGDEAFSVMTIGGGES